MKQTSIVLTHDARIADALAQILVPRVIREPAELILYRFRQWCIVDVRILRLLPGELGIEVGRIQHGLL